MTDLRAKAEAANLVERLKAFYTGLNNPPSDGLPDGAEIILKAAARIAVLEGANEWQPIETAPRYGVPVIVWDGSDVGQAYHYGLEKKDVWFWASDGPDDFIDGQIHPTHWMPLPPPPTQEMPDE